MDRFLLFAGDTYYPLGGASDLAGAFASLDDAKEAYDGQNWAHIFDLEQGRIVLERLYPWRGEARPWVAVDTP